MNISDSIFSPVIPLYKTSLPDECRPAFDKIRPNDANWLSSDVNAVQSPCAPLTKHALPIIHSTSCPIVIRVGSACGLIMRSGRNPLRVNGISASLITIPIVPFCPERDAILSPIAGKRSSRIRTFAILVPSSPSVINVLSTVPSCPFFVVFEQSYGSEPASSVPLIHPMSTTFSSISVPSLTNPFSSNLL